MENANTNEMVLLNVAAVIGNTLIYSGGADVGQITSAAIDIVSDLITAYAWLFDVSTEELEKERQIQRALVLLRESKITSRPAGDILVGVYALDVNWGTCVNVRLTPTMKARDLIENVVRIAKLTESPEDLSVYEVVCGHQLERILHHSDVVLGVTLSWSVNWQQEDAKGNYLLVKEHKQLFEKLTPYIQLRPGTGGLNTSSSMSRETTVPFFSSLLDELRFSDLSWGKTFKKVLFEFVNAKLSVYKDPKATRSIGSWKIEDIIWYMGCEKKRSPPTVYSFTFIDKNQKVDRKRENSNFIGRAVCCYNEDEYYRWIAGMFISEHPSGLTPPRTQIDLLL